MENKRSNLRKTLEEGRKKNRKEKVGRIREMKQEDDDEDRKKVKNYVEEEGKNPKDGKEEKLDPPDNPKTFVTPGRTV